MPKKINLAVLAAFIALTMLAVYIANNPTSIAEWQLRTKYLNRVVKLPVPFFPQEHSLSCEIACLRMALNYQGAHVSEQELIKVMPFDATTKKGRTWGDPNKGFVGDIDGEMCVNGYGVYWEPLALVGQHWRKTEIIEEGTAQDLASNLTANRPVIIWGHSGTGVSHSVEWETPLGKKISALQDEHARVVTGFAGDKQHPDVFIVLDPVLGELFWSRAELEKNWHSLGNHGVVVYAESPSGNAVH
ncbi:MAG: C39 family peptidase [Candidatus Obscuribacterales bacterium]